MASELRTPSALVLLGTGGTIAGAAASATDNVGYVSAQRGVEALVEAVPALARQALESEQVSQLDSKDLGPSVWSVLVRRVRHHLDRPDVAGVVITHGTDTLEETAWLLHRAVGAALSHKPVVLTAAMRPATSLQADGPQNLLDAVTVARTPGASGVVLVMAGQVWAGAEVRKLHSYRTDAFATAGAGPLGQVIEGQCRSFRPWPVPWPVSGHEAGGSWSVPDMGAARAAPDAGAWAEGLPGAADAWPWVEIVSSHAGAGPRAVQALVRAGVQGLVVACTGNGTVHRDLEAALLQAAAQGVPVLRATRCMAGGIVRGGSDVLPSAGELTPAQARVELSLRLLQPRAQGA